MSYSAVDTLQITKRLQNTGMKPESAEVLKERDEASFEKLATKEDLNREISSVRKELKMT